MKMVRRKIFQTDYSLSLLRFYDNESGFDNDDEGHHDEDKDIQDHDEDEDIQDHDEDDQDQNPEEKNLFWSSPSLALHPAAALTQPHLGILDVYIKLPHQHLGPKIYTA